MIDQERPQGAMATTEKKSAKRPAPDADAEKKPRKRKATAPVAAAPSGTTNKKKRKKMHQEQDEADFDIEAGLNRAFEKMDSQLLADHIAQRMTRFAGDLSSVELADLYISGEEVPEMKPASEGSVLLTRLKANAIKDTASWQKPRNLENLPEFLEDFTEDAKQLSEAPEEKGAPHTIVVAGAGLRAAELVRSLRKFSPEKKGNPVAKLVCTTLRLTKLIHTDRTRTRSSQNTSRWRRQFPSCLSTGPALPLGRRSD